VDGIKRAIKMIEDVIHDFEIGEVYENCPVTRIESFGAFVELLPGREGLCHVSQLAFNRVENVTDVVKVGDTLTVKVIEIDDRGKINVSHKATLNPSDRPAPKPSDRKPFERNSDDKKTLDTKALERKFSDRKPKPFDRNSRDKYGNRNRRRD
jgi:predicted RNA-binding protein with RPS1 domain